MPREPRFVETIAILRILDIAATRAFYLDYLGFRVEWEHRFAPDLPLYMAVRRGELALHLSEHHGDATPGSAVFVVVEDIKALHAGLDPTYRFARPGIEDMPWNARAVTLTDPAGNRIVFNEYRA